VQADPLKSGKLSLKGPIKITDGSGATVANVDIDLTIQ